MSHISLSSRRHGSVDASGHAANIIAAFAGAALLYGVRKAVDAWVVSRQVAPHPPEAGPLPQSAWTGDGTPGSFFGKRSGITFP